MTTKYLQISLSVAQLLVAPTSQIYDRGGIMEDRCFFYYKLQVKYNQICKKSYACVDM